MNLRCAVPRCGSFAGWRAVPLLAGLLVVPCNPIAAQARAQGWHPEYGFAFRPLIGIGALADVSGPAAGFDLGLHIVNESGGLGMRAVLGSNLLGSAQRFQTSGTILFWSVNGSYTTEQQISWWALGPSWSFPHPTARAEVYALLGMTSATASGNGMLVNTGGSEPGDSNSLVVIAGTLWCLHLPKSGLSAELGGELHLGGPGTFWDSPAIVADSSGGFVRRTREASMTGIALRFGLSYQRHARKR